MRKPLSNNTKVLTAAQTAELKRNALGILAEARKTVLNRFPFFGSVAMGLDLVPTRDIRIQTAATDGKSLYFDIDFLSTLSNDDKVFILAHEVMHAVMLHLLRKDNRDHMTFNYATDMEVNQLLQSEGMAVPKEAVMPALYGFPNGLNAEAYYDMLVDRNSSGANGNTMENGEQAKAGHGVSASNANGQFDKHIYKDEPTEDASACAKAEDRYGKLGEDPDYTPNVTQSGCERVREAAVAAAQAIERQGGSVSDNLKKIVNKLLEPKLDWRELLSSFISKAASGDKRTWTRCNRRFISSHTYLPSSQNEKLRVLVGLDTSGSVQSVLPRFLGELNGLVGQFDYELILAQFDTKVQDVKRYDVNEPLDLENNKFEVHGCGGTDIRPFFKHAIENLDGEFDVCVVLTDGEFYKQPEDPGFPVCWCLTKNGTKSYIKFGDVAKMEE